MACAILGWGHRFWLVLELSQHPHLPPFHRCLRVGRTALHTETFLAFFGQIEDIWMGEVWTRLLMRLVSLLSVWTKKRKETKGRWDVPLTNINRETRWGWALPMAKWPRKKIYLIHSFLAHIHIPQFNSNPISHQLSTLEEWAYAWAQLCSVLLRQLLLNLACSDKIHFVIKSWLEWYGLGSSVYSLNAQLSYRVRTHVCSHG